MGGGNQHALPPENASVSASAVTVENTKLSEAPVLFFVYFHKAFRAQLVELRRFASDASEADSFSGDVAVELCRKFDFLKLIYKYHSAAEDEVRFYQFLSFFFFKISFSVFNFVYSFLICHFIMFTIRIRVYNSLLLA